MKINSFGFVMKTCFTKCVVLITALLLVNCTHTKQPEAYSPFEYRDIHFSTWDADESIPLSLNSVDCDWGIWGHNLSVVLPEKPSSDVYAKTGNSVNPDQFCFSSDALYNYIKKYIKQHYGTNKLMRFAILPYDNDIVCLCKKCVELGNTENDASSAIYNLLERLTRQFPNHLFFTSYYRTACGLPSRTLPDNAGVLISAIDFPLCACKTSKEDEFMAILDQWSAFTNRIYIWDYISNFDDYFTPFPIFSIFQHRLKLYDAAGVKGIFMNGSGHEYSTFNMIKKQIMAFLLSNPNADWRSLLREFCQERFPVTGDVICDFMLKQEDMVVKQEETLSLYEGIPQAVKTYLPADEFVSFHNKLLSLLPETNDREHEMVEIISRATMFTRLELNRIAGDTVGCERMLDELAQLPEKGIVAYSEAGGTIDSYVEDYRYMLRRAKETRGNNLLKGIELEPLTALDLDYNDISILTDGLLGLPSSYHCGQMLSSATPALRIAIPHVQGLKLLRVNMTKNSIYHISLPLRVILTVDGHEIGNIIPKPLSSNLQRAVAEFNIPSNCDGKMVLIVYRDQDDRTMALDEIEGF